MMTFHFNFRTMPWPSIGIFLFVSVGILIAGHRYYQTEENKIINEKQNELSAIADLKTGQIDQWRNARIGDAKIIFKNGFLIHQVESFFRSPQDVQRKEELLTWMGSLIDSYSYQDVSLIDPRGNIHLSIRHHSNENETWLRENVAAVLKRREILFTDLHQSEVAPGIQLDILVPLVLPEKRDGPVIGIVLLCIDPFQLLFPLIQSWPMPSRTSETLLLRRDGDSILFLNDLRHLKNTALTLRFPVTREQLPAAMAARGREGTVEGIDYRNIPVLASIKRIPNSPWYMVAKVDQEEIYMPFHKQMTLVMVVIVSIILVTASSLGLWSRHQRLKYYQLHDTLELERQALISHFDYLFKYANDIILLADEGLKIIQANDRALESYGCTKDELLGLHISRLRAPQTVSQLPERIKLLNEVKTATFETIHQRKDGSTFPIEISARVIEIENKKYYQSIGRDITERKQAEEALQNNEKRFRAIVENSSDAITLLDSEGKILYESSNVPRITGYEISHRIGGDGFEMIIPGDLQHIKDAFRALLRESGTKVSNLQFRSIRADGTVWWAEGTATNLLQDPNVGAIVVNYRDITERKKAEEEIYRSHQMLQLVLDTIPQRVFWKNRNFNFLGCNKTFAQDAGLESPEQIIGKNDFQLSWKKSAALYRADDKDVMENNITKLNYEEPQDKPGGSTMWLRTSKIPLSNREGFVFGMLGTYEDISEQKRVQESLRESEERYRTLFENAQIGIYRITADGKILAANPALIHMLGYSSFHELAECNLDRERRMVNEFRHLFDGKPDEEGDVKKFENTWVRRDQSVILVSEYARVVRGADGTVLYYEGTIEDITERKQAEEKIKEMNEELEERVKERTAQLEAANKELESFSYSVSHDLRAPLRGIDGWSLALWEDFHTQLSEGARQNLERIRTETGHMGQLIDDLLKISRVTRTEMDLTSVDLTALAHSVAGQMKNRNPERQINFILEPGLTAWGDANLLEIVLTNLFENACKFTSKREIAEIEFGKTEMDGTSAFFMRDNGVGFDMEYAQNLFGAFWRMHKPSEFPGNGIGLATVARIIHRHGGRIWADAHVDAGATFYFFLKEES